MTDVGETAREVKSKREFGGNEGGTEGGGSGGGNSETGVLIGGSGVTVTPMRVGTQPCMLVCSSPLVGTSWLVCCRLAKEEGGMAGGGEGRDGEVEEFGGELIWSGPTHRSGLYPSHSSESSESSDGVSSIQHSHSMASSRPATVMSSSST